MKFLILLSLLASLSPQVDQMQENSVQKDTSLIVLTLEDALKVAMSENISVKVADKEITRTEYAKKGTYAALYPSIDAQLSYQRTIQKQVMSMEMGGVSTDIAVGKWNNWNGGVTAAMPIVNAQLWESIKISGDEVELAVEKARSSRLDMVTEVKNAFFTVLFAKESNKVYEQVYDNAMKNLEVTQMRYNAQKASEMDLARAKTTVANAVPEVYNSRNSIFLALWRLKAVMGVDLDYNMDVSGNLADFADQMFYDIHQHDDPDLSRNTSLRQLGIQIEELAKTVKLNQYAYIPSLALAFNYTYISMANDFNFSEYKWTPYSYVGLSINIPIFSGFKRLNDVRQSKVRYQEAKLQHTDLQRQLKIAIRSALSTMETSMNSYYAAQSAVESAQKAYDISATSYAVGRSTLVELNDALVALAQAQLAENQSIYSFLQAKDELEKQLGMDYIVEN